MPPPVPQPTPESPSRILLVTRTYVHEAAARAAEVTGSPARSPVPGRSPRAGASPHNGHSPYPGTPTAAAASNHLQQHPYDVLHSSFTSPQAPLPVRHGANPGYGHLQGDALQQLIAKFGSGGGGGGEQQDGREGGVGEDMLPFLHPPADGPPQLEQLWLNRQHSGDVGAFGRAASELSSPRSPQAAVAMAKLGNLLASRAAEQGEETDGLVALLQAAAEAGGQC